LPFLWDIPHASSFHIALRFGSLVNNTDGTENINRGSDKRVAYRSQPCTNSGRAEKWFSELLKVLGWSWPVRECRQSIAQSKPFDLVVIDGLGTQALEPRVGFRIEAKRVILAGDHCPPPHYQR
jgi:hypothetical protein